MLKIENISVNIEGKNLLKIKELFFTENEFCTILGSNGAGKSTLIKVLTGLSKFEGHLSFKDKYFKNWDEKELAKHRSVLQQSSAVTTNLSVTEILELGRYPYGRENLKTEKQLLRSILKQFNLEDFENRKIHTLSGGEQQRVHFARAYVQLIENGESNKNGLLFLDEPLNNLDIQNQLIILREARKFVDNRKGTVILVLHDINLANQFSDRILLMKNGRIIADGKPENVLTEENLTKTFITSIKVESTLSGNNYFTPKVEQYTHF